MKSNLKLILFFLFCLVSTFSFGQIVKGTGIVYTNGVPNHVPRISTESEYAVDISSGKGDLYLWNRVSNTWKLIPEGIDVISDASVPTGVPSYGQARFRVNTIPTLYFWTGVSWVPLTGTTYVAGTGIGITGNTINNTGDLSNTNEIQYIDTLRLTGNNLEISLYNDNVPLKSVSLSALLDNIYTTNGTITDQTRVVSIPGNLIFSNNSAAIGEKFSVGFDNGVSSTNNFSVIEGTGITLSSSENNIFLEGQTSFRDVVSPSVISGNVNNYTGLNGANVGILSSNGNYNITGIDNGVHGRILFLFNSGGFNITLKNQDVGSSTENQFYIGSDFVLNADTGAAIIMYDTLIPAWRMFKMGGVSTGGSSVQTVDTFSISGATISLSLSGDNLPANTINITESTQDITGGMFSGNTETGITATYDDSDGTIDLVASDVSPINELQKIDTFEITSNLLRISLLKDSVPASTVNLAPYLDNTDNQTIDTFRVSGSNVELSISNDGQPVKTIPVISIAPVQSIIAGTGISVSGTNNITIANTGDLSNTNEIQQIDTFELITGILRLSLTNDNVPFKQVDLSSIIAGGTDLSFSGSGPINLNSSTGTDVTFTAGTGISLSGTGTNTTITNSAPDQTVVLNGGSGIDVVGTYPNFTINATDTSITNEIQQIDTFSISGAIISNSLSSDGVPAKTLDITESVQDIAGTMTTGNTEVGINAVYNDGTGKVDFWTIPQQIDTFSVSGTNLQISLTRDSVPAKIVNLAGVIYANGVDSAFIKTDGTYLNKRITSNITRGGTTTFIGSGGSSTDTSGVLVINQGALSTKSGLTFGGNQPYLIRMKADSRADDNSDFIISRFFIDSVSTAGDNEVFSMGWNTAPGGGREDGTKSSLSIRMEKKFSYAPGDTIFELHLGEVYFANGGGRRPISAAIGHNANDGGDISFDSDYWTIHDFKTDDTKAQWVFGQVAGKNKGITFIDTASLFFEKPLSGSSIYFRDSLNSLAINALTVNSSNEVYIASTNSTVTRFGSQYLKVPTAGTLYTTDHSNFRIGNSTYKTGLIVHGNDAAALIVRGPNNATGVTFRVEASEFNIQVSGGASPFYLHNSAPQIGFYMNASGNIGLLTSNPQARQHIFTSGNHTTKMLRIENSTGSNDFYRTIASPNASITANPGDVAYTSISSFGEFWVKRTGTATNTGWESLIGAIRLTKAVPTTTDATQEIGVITHNEGGRSIFAEVDVNVAGSGFAMQKKYYIHLGFSSTSGWNTLIPITEGANSGWSGTNDFNLEMKTNTSGSPSGGIDTLRIRRVAGSTAANANITIRFFGAGVNTSFTETSATGTSTTTTLYGQGAIAQIGAKVGIRTLSPQQELHVEGAARITGNSGSPVTFMARDADGDINAVKLGSGFSFSNDTIKYTPTSTNTFYTSNGTVTNRDVEINGPLNFTDADGDGEVNITVGGLAGANLYMTPIEHRLEYFDVASLNQVTMDDSGVELATVLGTDNIRLNSSSTVDITANLTTFASGITHTNIITPTALSANTNDWNPTGLSTAYEIRISTTTPVNLTGIVAQENGRELLLRNVGNHSFTLKNNVTSTAANRFLIGYDYNVPPEGMVKIVYDDNDDRWFVSSPLSLGTGSGRIAGGRAQDVYWSYQTDTLKDFALGYFTNGTSDDKFTFGKFGLHIDGDGGFSTAAKETYIKGSGFNLLGTSFIAARENYYDLSAYTRLTVGGTQNLSNLVGSPSNNAWTLDHGDTEVYDILEIGAKKDWTGTPSNKKDYGFLYQGGGHTDADTSGISMWWGIPQLTDTVGSLQAVRAISKERGWGVQSLFDYNAGGAAWSFKYDWIKIKTGSTPADTAIHSSSNDGITLYGNKYEFPNELPTGDSMVMIWVGGRYGAQFINIDDIKGGGGSGGNGIYGGDGNIPNGGSQVTMDTLGETVRFVSDLPTTSTREMLRFSVAENAFTRFLVFTSPVDSARFFRASAGRQYTLQTYGGTAMQFASDSIISFLADSIHIIEGTAQTKTKVKFLLGMTSGNIVKRIDGGGEVGDIMVSDGTDWTLGSIGAHEINTPPTIRPSQLTATTNDWNPTGYSTTKSQTIELSGDGSFRTITGLTAATRDGVLKTFANSGTNCLVVAKLHTGSTAGNRFNMSVDLILYPKMEATFRYDSVDAAWKLINSTESSIVYNSKTKANIESTYSITTADSEKWTFTTNGGAFQNQNAVGTTAPLRYLYLSTNTAATSFPTMNSKYVTTYIDDNTCYYRMTGRIKVLSNLSTNDESYEIKFGFEQDADTTLEEGALLIYHHSLNSGNWRLVTNDGTTTNTVNTSEAVTANTFYNVELIYYPYGEVTCFINGTRYTTTSNLPALLQPFSLFQLDKDNGTTSRDVSLMAFELFGVYVSD